MDGIDRTQRVFLSHDAAYNYEILGPGFTFPDLFTLALLSLFFSNW